MPTTCPLREHASCQPDGARRARDARARHGTSADEIVSGTADDDTLYGMDGNDEMKGRDGSDLLHGNAGADAPNGMVGPDEVHGDEGDDEVFGGEGDDEVFGGEGDDVLFGGSGDDTLYGGGGNDRLVGGEGHDVLYGDAVGYEADDRYVIDGLGDDVFDDYGGHDQARCLPGVTIVGDEMDGDDRILTLAVDGVPSGTVRIVNNEVEEVLGCDGCHP